MRYNLIEILISIFDVFIFNNPVGIAAVITGFLLGIFVFKFGSKMIQLFCVGVLLTLTLISIVILIGSNSPDYLAMPMFMLPFFLVTSSVILICNIMVKINNK